MNASLAQTAAFVRQLTHDLRNDLGGIELEAALLATVVPEGEASEIIARLRSEVHKVAAGLQRLAGRFAEPRPNRMPFPARKLVELLKRQFEMHKPRILWTEALGEESMEVDAMSLIGVFQELLTNAAKFGDGSPVSLVAAVEDGKVVFSLLEQKQAAVDPSEWGRRPFASARRESYGLGLWEADRVVKANGGAVARRFKDGSLATLLSFPTK